MWHKATWRHPRRKRPKVGTWTWYWPGQYFLVRIGNAAAFRCYNETPDFDGWTRDA